jgi:putative FmdB family regulatory protein
MPVYEYACSACGHQFEEWQKMSDPPVRTCPKCKKKKVERLISQTAFQLKGGGWYADLYSSSKPGKGSSSEDRGGSDSSSKDGGAGGKDGGGKDKDASSKSGGGKDSGGKDASSKSDSGAKSDSSSKDSASKKETKTAAKKPDTRAA